MKRTKIKDMIYGLQWLLEQHGNIPLYLQDEDGDVVPFYGIYVCNDGEDMPKFGLMCDADYFEMLQSPEGLSIFNPVGAIQ